MIAPGHPRPRTPVGDAGPAHITTLGPLAVDGRPVRGDRLATVIRVLVDARGRAVSTALLVDAVWGGTPPDYATGAVQALVSRVRRLGLPVVAGPGGYRLPPEEITVDAVEARALTERGRAALRTGDLPATRSLADHVRALLPEVPDLVTAEETRLFADVTALRAEATLAGAGPFDETDLRRLVARTPPDECRGGAAPLPPPQVAAHRRARRTRGCPADHVMALHGSAISLTGFQAHRGAVVGFSL
jgi:hypothetical protein